MGDGGEEPFGLKTAALIGSGQATPAYTSPMPADHLEHSGLNRAWISAEAALPLGWRIEGVTCVSTGLQPGQPSQRWRAWATGPKGERIEAEGDWPIGALHALAGELAPLRSSMTG
jgi:hypothetical protein